MSLCPAIVRPPDRWRCGRPGRCYQRSVARRLREARIVVTAVVVGILLHCAGIVTPATSALRSSDTGITAVPEPGSTLALPGKRLPDAARPERAPELLPWRRLASVPAASRLRPLVRLGRAATSPPRARSHVRRVRVRVEPPDDPSPTTLLS